MPDSPKPKPEGWLPIEKRAGMLKLGLFLGDMFPQIAKELLAHATAADAVIKQQADRILALEKALKRAEIFEETIRDCGLPQEWELGDPRIKYVTVQIDKPDWERCQKALEGAGVEEGANNADAG